MVPGEGVEGAGGGFAVHHVRRVQQQRDPNARACARGGRGPGEYQVGAKGGSESEAEDAQGRSERCDLDFVASSSIQKSVEKSVEQSIEQSKSI